MNIGKMISLYESESPRRKAIAEIRSAVVILRRMEHDLPSIPEGKLDLKTENELGQHLDEVTMAMDRIGKILGLAK